MDEPITEELEPKNDFTDLSIRDLAAHIKNKILTESNYVSDSAMEEFLRRGEANILRKQQAKQNEIEKTDSDPTV